VLWRNSIRLKLRSDDLRELSGRSNPLMAELLLPGVNGVGHFVLSELRRLIYRPRLARLQSGERGGDCQITKCCSARGNLWALPAVFIQNTCLVVVESHLRVDLSTHFMPPCG
jgi:hypothetical protein